MDLSSSLNKNTHKYGIEVSKNILDDCRLEKFNVDNYWSKYISEEMNMMIINFDILDEGEDIPANMK